MNDGSLILGQLAGMDMLTQDGDASSVRAERPIIIILIIIIITITSFIITVKVEKYSEVCF